MGAGAGVAVVGLASLALVTIPWGLPGTVLDEPSWWTVFTLTASAVLCWILVAVRVMRLREAASGERHSLLAEAVALELACVHASEAPARLRSAVDGAQLGGLGPGPADSEDLAAKVAIGPRSLLTVEDWWVISQARSQATSPEQQNLDHHVREVLRSRFAMPDGTRGGAGWPRVPDSASAQVRAILAVGLVPITVAALVCMLLRSVDASIGAAQAVGVAVALASLLLIPVTLAANAIVIREPATRLREEVDHGRVALQEFCVGLGQVSRTAAGRVGEPLRAALADSAAELDRVGTCEEPRGLLAVLQLWEARLDAFMVATEASGAHTLSAEVTRTCVLWSGLCRISTSFNSDLAALRGPLAIAAGRIVEEAIGNACRHGHADEVRVTVDSNDEDGITVCVDDNGSGPLHGDPGVGRTMFADISGGRVSLTRLDSGGARLTVLVPWDFAGV